ncbi:MAG: tetratricopeptide repeat protein [Gemmatimonadaceae bacterium]|nr:tetratricopeptide repeat protein [Gemmatimonadaceae bacterium]
MASNRQRRRGSEAATQKFRTAAARESRIGVAKPHVDALLRESIACHLRGDLDGAVAGYRRVLARAPCAGAFNNLGAILAGGGQYHEAAKLFRESLALDPGDAEAQHNLGLAMGALQRPAEAVEALSAAVAMDAGRAAWWTDLGNVLVGEQRCDEALAAYDRAVAITPGNATALANRAIALRGLRRLDDAAEATRAALAVDPAYVDALSNLGIIEKERRRFDAARAAFDEALALAPGHATVRVNLAVLLMEMNRHAEAEAIAAGVEAECPGHPEALNVLGNCALERGALDEAERLHRAALAAEPANRNASWNLAVLDLLRGDYENGFRAFEARKRLISVVFTRRQFDVPEWDGSPLDGRSIFITGEQGAGDVIQFARYANELKIRGAGRVTLECPAQLAGILKDCPGVDATASPGDVVPHFDTYAYLMSLPMLCGTTLETIPYPGGYLAHPARAVRERVAALRGRLRVGVAWAGNPAHQRDAIRSVPLNLLRPLFDSGDISFVSLQKGPDATLLSGLNAPGNVLNLDDDLHDYSDTAAAMAGLDLVITVDTSVAHLAGALGVPTWILCPYTPDWRWMLGRTDSPWYSSVRLYRQPRPGAWGEVIASVRDDLGRLRDAAPVRAAPVRDAAPVRAAPVSVREEIEISWPVGLQSGWGTYGMHLALALRSSEHVEPVLRTAPAFGGMSPIQQAAAARLRVARSTTGNARHRLIALGNHALGDSSAATPRGKAHTGVIFFEDTAWDAAAIARARSYDGIIAGSTWNAELLRAVGITNVSLVLQGVDPAVFHPAPRAGLLGDRFLVFSGGKLEYRKGQDIVVEAFRRFHARHDDAVLVTAWHNMWPQTMAGIEATGYVDGLPEIADGRLRVTEWLARQGVPRDAVLDLGLQSHATIASVLHEVDIAVFPNRCEGGTNLVAMEAMACGVPVVLSANTGHLNLIGADTCYVLEHQAPIATAPAPYTGTFCWGESDPDELIAHLEAAYVDRSGAARRGATAAALMQELPWQSQAELLVAALGIS